MSNWDRRALMDLGDSIRSMLVDEAAAPEQKTLLRSLLEQADRGSKTVHANHHLLSEIRAKLCDACKADELCRCCSSDKGSWPYSCVLLNKVQANT
jgi:hypothetical protein